MPEIVVPRKHFPSFTLALSTLKEEPESLSESSFPAGPSTSRSYLTERPQSSTADDLMRTIDHRSERYFEYPVFLLPEDAFNERDDYDSDLETEVEYYDDRPSMESVTVYEVPKMRFMFFRRLAWRLLRRCPECGEKLGRSLDFDHSLDEKHTNFRWVPPLFYSKSSSSSVFLKN